MHRVIGVLSDAANLNDTNECANLGQLYGVIS